MSKNYKDKSIRRKSIESIMADAGLVSLDKLSLINHRYYKISSLLKAATEPAADPGVLAEAGTSSAQEMLEDAFQRLFDRNDLAYIEMMFLKSTIADELLEQAVSIPDRTTLERELLGAMGSAKIEIDDDGTQRVVGSGINIFSEHPNTGEPRTQADFQNDINSILEAAANLRASISALPTEAQEAWRAERERESSAILETEEGEEGESERGYEESRAARSLYSGGRTSAEGYPNIKRKNSSVIFSSEPLQTTFLEVLQESAEEVGGTITVTNALRTREQQALFMMQNYNRKIKGVRREGWSPDCGERYPECRDRANRYLKALYRNFSGIDQIVAIYNEDASNSDRQARAVEIINGWPTSGHFVGKSFDIRMGGKSRQILGAAQRKAYITVLNEHDHYHATIKGGRAMAGRVTSISVSKA